MSIDVKEKLNIGDIVRLNSGSPDLTVTATYLHYPQPAETGIEYVSAVFIDEENEEQRFDFPAACFTKVAPEIPEEVVSVFAEIFGEAAADSIRAQEWATFDKPENEDDGLGSIGIGGGR